MDDEAQINELKEKVTDDLKKELITYNNPPTINEFVRHIIKVDCRLRNLQADLKVASLFTRVTNKALRALYILPRPKSTTKPVREAAKAPPRSQSNEPIYYNYKEPRHQIKNCPRPKQPRLFNIKTIEEKDEKKKIDETPSDSDLLKN